MVYDSHASRVRILVGYVNQNMDKGLHAVHVLRIHHLRHFYLPTPRLRLLQMTQKIV